MAVGRERGELDADGMHLRRDGDRLFESACERAMELMRGPRNHGDILNGQRVAVLDSVCAAAVLAEEFISRKAGRACG